MKPALHRTLGTLLALALAAGLAASAQGLPKYEYNLADFTGDLPLLGAGVYLDPQRDEAYVLQGGLVRVFGPTGMEIYSFPLDEAYGGASSMAIDDTGDLFFLGHGAVDGAGGPGYYLVRCDFRGEIQERIVPTELTEAMQSFAPSGLSYAGGRFYLLDAKALQIAVLDPRGAVQRFVDAGKLIGLEPEVLENAALGGFAVDAQGTMVFSVPLDFAVYSLASNGDLRRFGKAGAKPGQFGVVGAVAVDADGDIYVADKLRSVVMIFDRDTQFMGEFGGHSARPDSISTPVGVAVSPRGRLYVSQMRKRGVSVFTRVPRGGQS